MNGNKIKEIREQKGIKISKLAKQIGMSVGYLSDIENNKKNNPTVDKLTKIADALGVSVKEFLTTEEQLERANTVINDIANLTSEALNKTSFDLENSIFAIASKFDTEAFTKEEQEEISNFINYVISKRK